MAMSAANYTCHLKVVINNEATEQDEVPVVITEENGVYNLSLENFVLWMGDFPMPVGNIVVNGVQGVDEHGFTTLKYVGDITITDGNDPQFDTWAGPLLGEVPLDMTTRFTDTAVNAHIDIDMQKMIGQVIAVELFGIAPAPTALEGDVNHDGEVTIADVGTLIDLILSM